MSGENWQPSASHALLQARATLLAGIRDFFHHAGVMEVETPIIASTANPDPAIESLECHYTGPEAPAGRSYYFHTSPEFPMKRLLAADYGPIYQICKVFRDGESGRLHNPEFTMLEWYRPGVGYHQLMNEVAALINSLLPSPLTVEQYSYSELFQHHLKIEPHQADLATLRQCAIDHSIAGADSLSMDDRDDWLSLIMTHKIEPLLGQDGLCFVYDYPATQASLAQIKKTGEVEIAERFELYWKGMELANGFQELNDATQQRQRFEAEIKKRQQRNLPTTCLDERLLAALRHGLPDCSGVALGVDRLLMAMTGLSQIQKVLTFPFSDV